MSGMSRFLVGGPSEVLRSASPQTHACSIQKVWDQDCALNFLLDQVNQAHPLESHNFLGTTGPFP